MKFYQAFIGLLAASIALVYAGLNVFIHGIANAAMIGAGILLLALDVFAFLVWFVNWKYYPETRE